MKTGIEVSKSIGTLLLLFTAGLAQSPRFAPREKDCFHPVAPSGAAVVLDGDGDGVPDILVGNSSGLVFYRNDGRGHFTRGATSAGALDSLTDHATSVGDVDGDGDDDLFTTGLLRNLGNGQFGPLQPVLPFSTLQGPNWFFDADNDGDLDLIARTSLGMRWYSNDGTGNFTFRSTFVVPGGTILDMLVMDAELDGDQDLVAGTLSSPALLRNDGSGNFTVDTTAFAGIPGSLFGLSTAADIDGDGFPDLVQRSPGNLVHRNDGSGHFTSVAMTGVPLDAFLGNWTDWNQDGRADFLLNGSYGSAGIYRNAGSFSFVYQGEPPRIQPADEPWFADLDGDLDLDLVRGGAPVQVSLNATGVMIHATTTATSTTVPPLVRSFGVNPAGDVLAEFVTSPGSPAAPAGDGLYLLYWTASSADPTYRFARRLAPPAQFLDATLADGFAAYCTPSGPMLFSTTASNTIPLPGSTTSTHIASGDLDGDLDVEFVLGDPNADGPEIVRRTAQYPAWFSAGRIAVPPATPHPSPAMESVVVVDMDGDGNLDILHELRLLQGVGDGTFVVGADFAAVVGATTKRLLPFDLDGDGDQDLLAYGGTTTQLIRNDGAVFVDASLGQLPTSEFGTTTEASAADVDRDGDTDLLLCRNGAANLLRNNGGVLARFPAITPTGVFVDRNADGWPDVFTGSQSYRNLHDHLWTPYRPALGTTWPIHVETWRDGLATQFAVVVVGKGIGGFGGIGVDLTQPAAFYVVPLVGGSGQVTLSIPATSTALGVVLGTQAVVVDPVRLQLTNPLVEVVL